MGDRTSTPEEKALMQRTGSILVVDDEPDTVDLIRLTLETAGFTVAQALDGTTAIQMLEQDHYDVLLLDIMMPEMSGFDVVVQLRDRQIPVPPLIFLTARKRSEDRQAGEDIGAVGYLTKPATRGDLLDTIDRAMKG
jgi:DNA-binding response OmpR family regulator